MSFTEVLNELPALTVEQRQLLMSRVLELDELPLSPQDEALIEDRLAARRRNPSSALSLAEAKDRLTRRFSK